MAVIDNVKQAVLDLRIIVGSPCTCILMTSILAITLPIIVAGWPCVHVLWKSSFVEFISNAVYFTHFLFQYLL